MKKGFILNLIILAVLLFLILLPLIVFNLAITTAQAIGCDTSNDMGWGEGRCQELYTLVFLTGLFGGFSSILFAAILLLYLAGVLVYFGYTRLRSRQAGAPPSPVAGGMLLSSAVILGLGLLSTSLYVLVNRYQTYGGALACKSLPTTIPAPPGVQNGPLALSLRRPYPEGRPEQYILQILSLEGELLATINQPAGPRTPAWSPDGQTLAFAASGPLDSPAWGLYTAHWDGHTLQPAIQVRSDPLEMLSPAWSPDGASLLFQRAPENPQAGVELFRLELGSPSLSTSPHQLTTGKNFNGLGRYSPDGQKIVYVSRQEVFGDIYLMNADGSGVRRLTRHPRDDTHPAWSPDGQWIVFASNREDETQNVYDLYIMRADGSSQCRLTTAPGSAAGSEWQPAWSPDGQWIAFIDRTNDLLYRLRPDGSDLTPIPLPEPATPLSLDWARLP